MRMAVKFWKDNPEIPLGMPGDYPWICRQLNESEPVGDGWIEMDSADLDAYIALKTPQYEKEYLGTWFDSDGVIHPWHTWPGAKLGIRRLIDHVFG